MVQPNSGSPFVEIPTARNRRWKSTPVSVRSCAAAVILFAVTVFTTTTLGAGWYLSTRTDVISDLGWFLSRDMIQAVWSNPELKEIGFAFSLPALLILLVHELGHYFACRRYGIAVTPPFFLPAPLGLGTFGAFIRIRSSIRDRRQLLDIGSAGPIAGFLALLPFLIYGIAKSVPVPVKVAEVESSAPLLLLLPGKCLAIEILSFLFHGRLQSGWVLDLHPFALAAWLGLLATSLNLLPLSQLDGGHILYAAGGNTHRRLTFLLLALLALAGLLFWRGWLVWCLIVVLMGLRHPNVADPAVRLDRGRRWIAIVCLVVFVLAFMPVPVTFLPIEW